MQIECAKHGYQSVVLFSPDIDIADSNLLEIRQLYEIVFANDEEAVAEFSCFVSPAFAERFCFPRGRQQGDWGQATWLHHLESVCLPCFCDKFGISQNQLGTFFDTIAATRPK